MTTITFCLYALGATLVLMIALLLVGVKYSHNDRVCFEVLRGMVFLSVFWMIVFGVLLHGIIQKLT